MVRSPAARAAVLGVLCLLAACSLPSVGLFDPAGIADTGLYGQYGHNVLTGRVPYRDFYFEFPPGAVPALALPDLVHAHYVVAFKVFEFLSGAAAISLLALLSTRLGAGPRRLYGGVAAAGLSPALLGPITLNSFDFWPALVAVASVLALVSGRSRLALFTLGAAVTVKLFPLVLLPLFLAHVLRAEGRRRAAEALGWFLAAIVVVVGPFAALAPGGVGFSLRTQLERGLQIESLGSSILLAAHRLGLYHARVVVGRPYSLDLAGPLAKGIGYLAFLVVAGGVLLVLRGYLRGEPGGKRLAAAAAASVLAFVAFGKVLSPQYLVWLVPLVPAAASAPALTLFAVALGLTQVWFPDRFHDLLRLGGVTWVVLARNLVLVALYAVLVRASARSRSA